MGKPTHLSKSTNQAKQTPANHPGLVLAHYGQTSLIETQDGDLLRCSTRKNLPRTVCGDHILFEHSSPHDGVITDILERSTTLVRPDRNGRIRPVAANIDQIVVVIASKPSFEISMLDSYLVAAEIIGAGPVIVVNKSDLLNEASYQRLEQRLSPYSKLGYSVLFTSTQTTDGLKNLYAHLQQHTSVLVGQSGVGKSSLAQALLPDLAIRTGQLSQVTGLGRHTTTTTTLYHLPDTGNLIDSPGVREFSLWQIDAHELAHGFTEFRPYLGLCRFRNCLHNGEPGCQINEAARDNHVTADRLASYRHMLASQHAQKQST